MALAGNSTLAIRCPAAGLWAFCCGRFAVAPEVQSAYLWRTRRRIVEARMPVDRVAIITVEGGGRGTPIQDFCCGLDEPREDASVEERADTRKHLTCPKKKQLKGARSKVEVRHAQGWSCVETCLCFVQDLEPFLKKLEKVQMVTKMECSADARWLRNGNVLPNQSSRDGVLFFNHGPCPCIRCPSGPGSFLAQAPRKHRRSDQCARGVALRFSEPYFHSGGPRLP